MLSACNLFKKGHGFFVFRMNFDGSGKENNFSHFLTLSCFGSDFDGWTAFDLAWDQTLQARKLSHMHMNRLFSGKGKGEFANWGTDEAIDLVDSLNALICNFSHTLFRGFYVTAHLDAYRYWRPIEPRLPPASKDCALRVFAAAFDWYSKACGILVITKVDAIYDRTESFLGHIHRDWCSKNARSKFPFLGLLQTVAPGDASKTPGLQAADMVAWCANKLKIGTPDTRIVAMCDRVLANPRVTKLDEIDADYMQEHLGWMITSPQPKIVA